jgi:hypothetical protein
VIGRDDRIYNINVNVNVNGVAERGNCDDIRKKPRWPVGPVSRERN